MLGSKESSLIYWSTIDFNILRSKALSILPPYILLLIIDLNATNGIYSSGKFYLVPYRSTYSSIISRAHF